MTKKVLIMSGHFFSVCIAVVMDVVDNETFLLGVFITADLTE